MDPGTVCFGEVQFFLILNVPGLESNESDESAIGQHENKCEHYVALIKTWRVGLIDDDVSTRRIMLVDKNRALKIIPIKWISCSVGVLKTAEGEWVITRSINSIWNPAEEF